MTLQTAQPDARIGEFFWIKCVLANAAGFAAGAAEVLPSLADEFCRLSISHLSRLAARPILPLEVWDGNSIWAVLPPPEPAGDDESGQRRR